MIVTSTAPNKLASSALASSALASSALASRSISSNIRWGILSAGKIASDFVKAIAVTEGAETAAVAARCPTRSKNFALQHSIGKSYGDYDELINDPEIDVVYVGSVADHHAELATRSLLAGKPTVVEKPLTLSLQETKSLVGLARKQNTFLMEGMWTRCFPAMRKVRDVVVSGEIGDVVAVQGDFGWSTMGCGPNDRIWSPYSGGMTLDIGMYMAQLGSVAFPGASVDRVQAMGTTKNCVDHTVMANVMFHKNINGFRSQQHELYGKSSEKGLLQFYVTGEANTEERVSIQGTHGRIVLDAPAHIPEVVRVFRDEGRGESSEKVFNFSLPDDSHETWNYPGSIGFTHQISEVGEALKSGEKECRHFTLNESLQVAAVLDSILCDVNGGKKNVEVEEFEEQAAATYV